MAWMEALNALAEHSRRKSTTFYITEVFIFEGPPNESDWTWYPDSLVLLRRDSADLPQNITHEELFVIGNIAL